MAGLERATVLERIARIEEKIESMVTLDRFKPVERLVYGAVALALTALVTFGAGTFYRGGGVAKAAMEAIAAVGVAQ